MRYNLLLAVQFYHYRNNYKDLIRYLKMPMYLYKK